MQAATYTTKGARLLQAVLADMPVVEPVALTVPQALDEYRDAVARRAHAERSGWYGDGNLERAQEVESATRQGVFAAMRRAASDR